MSVWIANKDKYGKYQFDEKLWPSWYTPEDINVGTVQYYRNIIENSNITYYLYSCERLGSKGFEELEIDWLGFCATL